MRMFLWALLLGLFACGKSAKPDTAPPARAADGSRRIDIAVTDKGFEPEKVSVKKGEPVTLVFTRKTDETCAKEVIIPLGADKIDRKLPLGEPVTVAVTFPTSGQVRYACDMDMIAGVVIVE